jgi:hypothetical protein
MVFRDRLVIQVQREIKDQKVWLELLEHLDRTVCPVQMDYLVPKEHKGQTEVWDHKEHRDQVARHREFKARLDQVALELKDLRDRKDYKVLLEVEAVELGLKDLKVHKDCKDLLEVVEAVEVLSVSSSLIHLQLPV